MSEIPQDSPRSTNALPLFSDTPHSSALPRPKTSPPHQPMTSPKQQSPKQPSPAISPSFQLHPSGAPYIQSHIKSPHDQIDVSPIQDKRRPIDKGASGDHFMTDQHNIGRQSKSHSSTFPDHRPCGHGDGIATITSPKPKVKIKKYCKMLKNSIFNEYIC